MVTAEKNTNPFANGNVQNVCGDATLPVTPELRGITPLIDPDVDVDGAVAALSESSAAAPLAADGLSVFDLLDQAGLGDLVTAQDAAGGAAADGASDAAAGDDTAADDNAAVDCNAGNAAADDNAAANEDAAADDDDDAAGGKDAAADEDAAAGDDAAADEDAAAEDDTAADDNAAVDCNAGNAAADDDAATGEGAGADFGLCTPTITFQAGENGRAADEFTFQIADPLARGGQQEALNPDIITNALCNQLTNVCEANDAAVAACEDAAAQVAGGERNKALADEFNSLLGFAGAVTNPDGGPEDVGDVAAARRMRRGLRA
jgi:hypothetical protein